MTAGVPCVVEVNVVGNSTATNTTSQVEYEDSFGVHYFGPASATLTVDPPPTVTKAFNPASIPAGATSTLTITINNPTSMALTFANTGLNDIFPAGLNIANPPGVALSGGCTGNPFAPQGGDRVQMGSLSVPSGSTCVVTLKVLVSTMGAKINTVRLAVTGHPESVGQATLNVTPAPPTVTKTFAAPSIPFQGTTSMTLAFTNPNTVTMMNVSVSDTLQLASLTTC